MTSYETFSLVLTGTYDLLTFGLLLFVAYESFVKPRQPNIAFNLQRRPRDTDSRVQQRNVADFVLENRGVAVKNVRITSEPDDLRWGMLRELTSDGEWPMNTSRYFAKAIPSLARNERLVFFWCDLDENAAVATTPFTITLAFDNPAPHLPWCHKRVQRSFAFNLSVFENVAWGLTRPFDIHNVAEELARIRDSLRRDR